jgi:hypothetical protein
MARVSAAGIVLMTAFVVAGAAPVAATGHPCGLLVQSADYVCKHYHDDDLFICPVYIMITGEHIGHACIHADIAAGDLSPSHL